MVKLVFIQPIIFWRCIVKIQLVLAAALLISGCVEQQIWVRNNVTYDQYERDFVGCQTTATQAVPTNTQVSWAPYVGIYSVDTNSQLRQSNFEICMRDRGYSPVTVEPCTGTAQTAANEQSRLPSDRNRVLTVTANTCYVYRNDGTPYLYSGTL